MDVLRIQARARLTAIVLLTQWACCTQVGPVVAHGDLNRDELIRQLGEPTVHEVTSVADVVSRKLIDDPQLLERARQVEPRSRVEIVKWEAACWTGSGDYFVALLDPETGRILQNSGHLLFAGRTQLD